MELGDAAAWIAAGIASIAALIAIWQAVSASRQAQHAEEQADAAKLQAMEAVRAADVAESQYQLTKLQFEQSRKDSEVQRRVAAYKALTALTLAANQWAIDISDVAELVSHEQTTPDSVPETLNVMAERVMAAYFDYLPFAPETPFHSDASTIVKITNINEMRSSVDYWNAQAMYHHLLDQQIRMSVASRRLREPLYDWVLYNLPDNFREEHNPVS